MPVKVDPEIQEALEALDLTIWEARHPKVVSGVSEKTGKLIHRENKERVNVVLQGPGLPHDCLGFGSTLQAAVDDALASPALIARVPGLKGSIMRLERAVGDLRYGLAAERFKVDPDLDDDIPF